MVSKEGCCRTGSAWCREIRAASALSGPAREYPQQSRARWPGTSGTADDASRTRAADPAGPSNLETVRLSVAGPDQAVPRPVREIFVVQATACDRRDGLRDYLVAFDELIATSLHQQFRQIESRSLVAIRISVIRNDAVHQRGCLLVDVPVIAVVRAGERRLNRMLAYDPWSPAMPQCFLMAANCIALGSRAKARQDPASRTRHPTCLGHQVSTCNGCRYLPLHLPGSRPD